MIAHRKKAKGSEEKGESEKEKGEDEERGRSLLD